MNRTAAIEAISALSAELQGAYDDRDRALADRLGVGRTDLRCLDILIRGGPTTAARLGPQLHLTRGSMTTLVQRLEAARYVERRADPGHGRRKIIAPTAHLIEQLTPLTADLARQGASRLDDFTDAQLATIDRYLRDTVARQAQITESSRNGGRAGGPSGTSARAGSRE